VALLVARRTHLLVHPPHLFVEVLGGGRADGYRARRLRGWRDFTTAAVRQRCRHQLWGRGQESETGCTGARESKLSLRRYIPTSQCPRNETKQESNALSARKRQRLQSHFIPSEVEQQNPGLEPISTLLHHQPHAHRM